MNKDSLGFKFLRAKFLSLSDVKTKEGIFVGPDIKNIIKDSAFILSLNDVEKDAWTLFVAVTENFLGIHKFSQYVDLVEKILQAFHQMKCNISLKIHFLDSHLNFFPKNMGAMSDEHGERFQQDIAVIEKRYQEKLNPAKLTDYCWLLIRETPTTEYNRQTKKIQKEAFFGPK